MRALPRPPGAPFLFHLPHAAAARPVLLEAVVDVPRMGESADHRAIPPVDNREAQLDVQCLAIRFLGPGGERLSAILRVARFQRAVVSLPMGIAELVGHYDIETLAHCLDFRIAEHGGRRRIPGLDDPVVAGEDDGVGRLLYEQGGERRCGFCGHANPPFQRSR